jgi:8-oxo-dGTP diphosphatase
MPYRPHRIAARALILHEDRLLLVNAYPAGGPICGAPPAAALNPGHSCPTT